MRDNERWSWRRIRGSWSTQTIVRSDRNNSKMATTIDRSLLAVADIQSTSYVLHRIHQGKTRKMMMRTKRMRMRWMRSVQRRMTWIAMTKTRVDARVDDCIYHEDSVRYLALVPLALLVYCWFRWLVWNRDPLSVGNTFVFAWEYAALSWLHRTWPGIPASWSKLAILRLVPMRSLQTTPYRSMSPFVLRPCDMLVTTNDTRQCEEQSNGSKSY